mgnify:CR=1 FL=1
MDKGAVKEDNPWLPYFQSIKNSCPWSLKAYMKEKILFVDYAENQLKTWVSCFGATKFEALVFKCKGKSVDWLKQKEQELNALNDGNEYLWSHPDEGGESTPVPVIICQNEKVLNDIREKLGHG